MNYEQMLMRPFTGLGMVPEVNPYAALFHDMVARVGRFQAGGVGGLLPPVTQPGSVAPQRRAATPPYDYTGFQARRTPTPQMVRSY